MEPPKDINSYLKVFSTELGDRILESFPPLHGAQDPPSPLLSKLLRRPYAAQAVAISGVVARLAKARAAAGVAECRQAYRLKLDFRQGYGLNLWLWALMVHRGDDCEMKTPSDIYELRITLQEVRPPIWRLIQIPSTSCGFLEWVKSR